MEPRSIILDKVDVELLARQYLLLIDHLGNTTTGDNIIWGLVEMIGDVFDDPEFEEILEKVKKEEGKNE